MSTTHPFAVAETLAAAEPAEPGAQEASTDPYAASSPSHNEGQGRRLTAAFEALEAFPLHVETRNKVLRMFDGGEPATTGLIDVVEGDIALCLAVLRRANQMDGPARGRVDSVVSAIDLVTPAAVLEIASHARTYDFFERTTVWGNIPERFRLHAVTTQRAADRLAEEVEFDERNRLLVSTLMHDLGKLVLIHAYPGYPRQVHADARTPEERLQRERRELGVDHALVGGVIARRWGLPSQIAHVIESHHEPDEIESAIVRLADLLAHYLLGGLVNPQELANAAGKLGLRPSQLREVMFELPTAAPVARPRQVEPCPMSNREVDVLKGLARGMVYKQIASELGLSTSTVRTHLHNIYGKLGAMDRAQAVLMATDHGWI